MCSAECEQRLLEHPSAAVTACLHGLSRWHSSTSGSKTRALDRTLVSDLPPACFRSRLLEYPARGRLHERRIACPPQPGVQTAGAPSTSHPTLWSDRLESPLALFDAGYTVPYCGDTVRPSPPVGASYQANSRRRKSGTCVGREISGSRLRC